MGRAAAAEEVRSSGLKAEDMDDMETILLRFNYFFLWECPVDPVSFRNEVDYYEIHVLLIDFSSFNASDHFWLVT